MRRPLFAGWFRPALGFVRPIFLIVAMALAAPSFAQTTQPFVFTAANINGDPAKPAIAVFTRDDTIGTWTPVSGSPFAVSAQPTAFAVDVQGRFLFAACGASAICMYTLDKDVGTVTEVAGSPFASSYTDAPVFLGVESTGQYLLVANSKCPSVVEPACTSSIETFTINASAETLTPYQVLSKNSVLAATAQDPRFHAIYAYYGYNVETNSWGVELDSYTLDPTNQLFVETSTGIGDEARSLAVDPQGAFLVAGHGEYLGSFELYPISAATGLLAIPGSNLPMPEVNDFPSSMAISSSSQFLYIGENGDVLMLPSGQPTSFSPLAAATNVQNWWMDPTGPFVAVSSNYTPGINLFAIDSTTGNVATTPVAGSPFGAAYALPPVFYARTANQQPVVGPGISFFPTSLSFSSTTVGQSSSSQSVQITSNGEASLSLSAMAITGANAADFGLSTTCSVPGVLQPAATCGFSIVFTPSAAGTRQASVQITDNAGGSPHLIPLTGAATAPAPQVLLVPGTLSFPGSTTQGGSSLPQTVTLTNQGTAALQMSSVALSGGNSSEFSLSSNSCTGSIAVNASCTVNVVFSPTSPGLRQTSLVFTNSAASSPQTVAVSGTALAAATLSPVSTGGANVSVNAGQTATFNLQVSPGSGFTGTVAFTCSGAPFAATCTVTPTSVNVTNTSSVPFVVNVATTGTAPAAAFPQTPVARRISGPRLFPWTAALALLVSWFLWMSRERLAPRARFRFAAFSAATTCAAVLLAIGCGGGASQTKWPPPPQQAATPALQPNGGTFSTQFPSITISDATTGATIYYTVDGTTPTTASPVYSAAFTITSPTTVQAMAVATGYTNSLLASATYSVLTPSGTSVITISATATPAGSTKALPLTPISLSLTVN